MQSSGLTLYILFLLSISFGLRAQEQAIEIGKVYTMHSENLGEEREYRVLLPRSYQSGQGAYPVVYVLDGESYYLSAYSAVMALAGQSNMPESIVVAVSNPNRTADMTPPDMRIPQVPSAKGDQFLAFLADELIPYIDQTYRTRPLRVLIGHSHGAIFSLYALSARPEAFTWQVALDAPMHLDNHYLEKNTEDYLKQNPGHIGRLVVGWARYEWKPERWAWLENRAEQGFKAWEIALPDETHSSMYHTGMYLGLKKLFADHEYRHTEILSLAELDKRYRAMNEEYGYDIPIPLWALRYGALEHLVAADAKKARPFVERLLKDHGSAMIFDDNAMDWLNELEKSPPAEARKAYLNRKDATIDEAKPFLGIWKGHGYEIHIGQSQEQLKAKIVQFFPDGARLENEMNKLVAYPDGSLELTHKNGMPPLSGLIYFRLSLAQTNAISVEKGFRVYWPSMTSRNVPQVFTATK